MPTCRRIWTRARLATMAVGGAPYGAIEDGLIAEQNGRILWAGPRKDAPAFQATEAIDCAGRWITPGLIDCHTHLVHGGDRAHEFELRLGGATYEEIARAGGGIVSTVRATREASEADLFASAARRLADLIAEGVTTIEIKSGYGLDIENETKTLRVARRIGRERPVSVSTTFLGAHATPPEYKGRDDAYIDLVAGPMLDAIVAESLADAVDVFCEGIAFSTAQTERVFKAARAKKLPVKIHAEQLSNLGGAALAASYGALSADHIEYLDEAGVDAMARAGTIGVLLPGAFYFIREKQLPPIALLRDRNVPIAIATDCNPGTSPMTSILLTMNMASTLFRLTPEEALAGVTRNAAQALGLLDDVGTIAAGKRCDLAIWDIERPAELSYRIGANPLFARVWGGK